MNLYFQDESRFGLMTHIGKCLTARGVKPIVEYQQAFNNTYLYGSYSCINGDSFTWEIEGTTSNIFYDYLCELSKHNENELKIIVIDNAGFHSVQKFDLPDNIVLIRIPPYNPELNPAEKIWAYIKSFYKNRVFKTIQNVKEWLHDFVQNKLSEDLIKSITHHQFYINAFNEHFEI